MYENDKLNFSVAEDGPFGTPLFDPQKPPEKVHAWVPFFRPFPRNEAHELFFLGAQNGGLNGGTERIV